MPRIPAMRTLENALRRVGFVHVAGVDEVGRGCLAGPVVAAAVVLHPDRPIPGVCDSKLVPAIQRDRQMLELHGRDPRYGFDRHKGYATAEHLVAVARFGYSDVHRRSFRPPTLFDTID